jgi:organic radical activating enzyme
MNAMDDPQDQQEPPYLENIGLFLTFKCEVACSHCSVKAGPHRTEAVDEREAFDWIRQAASYDGGRVKAINMTGGEPFFDLPALRRLVRFIHEQGLFATSVTNASWARTPTAAIETLQSVPELLMIQISADEQHQKEIPLERVRNAVAAARELGLVYSVAVCTEDTTSPGYLQIVDELKKVAEPDRIQTTIMVPNGRALVKLGRRAVSESQEGRCGGAETPIIFPDGRVLSCVGALDIAGHHPLLLGNLREESLARILDGAETNLALHYMRLWGPARLRELLQARGFDCGPTAGTSYPCGLCRRIMSRPGIDEPLARLPRESDTRELVAYGRVHYFGEEAMVVKLGLDQGQANPDSPG